MCEGILLNTTQWKCVWICALVANIIFMLWMYSWKFNTLKCDKHFESDLMYIYINLIWCNYVSSNMIQIEYSFFRIIVISTKCKLLGKFIIYSKSIEYFVKSTASSFPNVCMTTGYCAKFMSWCVLYNTSKKKYFKEHDSQG